MCIAAAIAGGAILGGAVQAYGATQAADTQAQAAQNAQNISFNEFQTITGQQQPFMQAGYGALSALNQGLGVGTPNTANQAPGVGFGSLTTPFTAENWQQLSPQYNFTKQQGIQGVLNQDASSQGALSGAAAKDLINYTQSAANQSFGQAFNQYQTQQGNIFNRLSTIAQLGQNAAANTGMQGTQLAGQAAQSATNIGTALAGGTVGAANAFTGGLSSALPWLYQGANVGQQGNPAAWDTENPANFQDWGYSDKRLKQDIERVGELDSGLPIYRFRYKGPLSSLFLGVMAQDVEKKFPEAVRKDAEGMRMVDYGAIR